MPAVSGATQKALAAQFMSITNADRSTAVKFLKSQNWNVDNAINGFFGASSAAPSGSKDRLNKIFDKYRDVASEPDNINISGMMKYLGDIGVDIEDVGMLAVSELVKSEAMGEMKRSGFVEGWSAAGCDTLEKQKSYVQGLVSNLSTSKDTFTKIYKHTFQLAKTGTQKAVPLDMATPYWQLLFGSRASAVKWSTQNNAWLDWWIEFLTNEWKRSINKDVWNETLRFAQETLKDESLSFWSEESSWPSVIDDFVLWVKAKRGQTADGDVMEE